MTIPWYSNCPHLEDAWCIDCAAKLGEEMVMHRAMADDYRAALRAVVKRRGFHYYDEGWNARVVGEPFNHGASRDWRDGWKDCDGAQEKDRTFLKDAL